MVKGLSYYMGLPYRMEVVEDQGGGGYALNCPELPGCITCAETIEEGICLLEDAKRAWLTAALENGLEIPEPDCLAETETAIQEARDIIVGKLPAKQYHSAGELFAESDAD